MSDQRNKSVGGGGVAAAEAGEPQDMNRALVDLLRLHGVKPSAAIAILDDMAANGMVGR